MSKRKENVLNLIGKNYLSMPEAEKKIADFILKNPEDAIYMTVHQLSVRIGVSDGTIIRFSNRLGYDGFTQIKINIAQNIGNKEEVIYDRLSAGDTPKKAMLKTFENAIAALRQTGDFISNEDLERAAELIINAQGKIEFYGIGSSSMVALDAYYRFMRIGLEAYAVTDALISCVSANMLDKYCVAVGISHSGRTIETLRAMEIAKGKGAKTICLTSFARSPLAQMCDVNLIIASNETEHQKEAVASRLVQLAVLDSLCGYVTMRQAEKSIDYMENLVDLLGEHRK